YHEVTAPWRLVIRCVAECMALTRSRDDEDRDREQQTQWRKHEAVETRERSATDTLENPDEPENANGAREKYQRETGHRQWQHTRGNPGVYPASRRGHQKCRREQGDSDDNGCAHRRPESRPTIDLGHGTLLCSAASQSPVDVQRCEGS